MLWETVVVTEIDYIAEFVGAIKKSGNLGV